MIEIPIHNAKGEKVDTFQLDEQLLGGRVRPILLKQAFVRSHANRRQGSANNRNRSQVEGSTRKLYKQKGTGNARRGAAGTNIMRGGGRAFAKSPKSWRQKMPDKMRRLANRNALLAKAVDGELKLLDKFDLPKPSTKQFASILAALKIDRSCLVAVATDNCPEAQSAANIDNVLLTRIDRLNTYDLLNHRYVLADKASLNAWLAGKAGSGQPAATQSAAKSGTKSAAKSGASS